MTRNKNLRRFIDRRVKYWRDFYYVYCDAGVKGMKKGQHVMARDPDYVQALKGGGGGKPAKPAQNKYNPTKERLKLAGVIGGTAAGIAGLGLLGRKLGRSMGKRMAAGKVGTAKNPEVFMPSKPKPSTGNPFKKNDPFRNKKPKKKNPFSGLTNTKTVQQNLNNPNHVWDI